MTVLAVFDCTVILQGAARPNGPAAACIGLVNGGKVALAVSLEIVAEIRDVLNRPRLRKKFPRLTPELVDEFVTKIVSKANVLDDVPAAYIRTGSEGRTLCQPGHYDKLVIPGQPGQRPSRSNEDPVAFLRAIGDPEKAAPPADSN